VSVSSNTEEIWNLWLDGSHTPYENMAIDESLLHHWDGTNPVLRIYEWDRPSASIGYFQKYKAVGRNEYTVVRRPTGGGIVFHDFDLTYALVIPAAHPVYRLKRCESYRDINRSIITALAYMDIEAGFVRSAEIVAIQTDRSECFRNPTRYDVLLNGEKIAGAAQRRNQKGLLHQGSINLRRIPGLSRDDIKSSLITGFEKNFTCSMIEFEPSSEFFRCVDNVVREKFGTSNWNKKR
jgi:lipoate-protein ligase A